MNKTCEIGTASRQPSGNCAQGTLGNADLLVLLSGVFGILLAGCAHFQDQPLSIEKSDADFRARSLVDPGLKAYLVSNHLSGEWPRPVWDFGALTLAAFYYQPALDVARATWGVATAGETTAGESPNPTLSVSPAYNTTTSFPSPWIVTPWLDIPIETAGKRGYRIAQATRLSEAARLNIASVAWQVRSALRRSLVDLDAAQSKVALLREQQEIQTENLRLLNLQFQEGAISAFELTQARLAANSTLLAVYDAERRRAEARVQLARSIGIPTAALDAVELSFEGLHELPAEIFPTEAQRLALFNRADIRGALAEYAAAQSALQLEIARQYPDIHLNPGYEFDQGDNKWSVGASVTLPVLNQNQGAIAEARARRVESAARFNALQAAAIAEVDLAATGYRSALEKQAHAETMLANRKQHEESAHAMLEAGEISKSDLVALQLQSSADAIARLDALTEAQLARGQLEDALQSLIDPMSSTESSPRTALFEPGGAPSTP